MSVLPRELCLKRKNKQTKKILRFWTKSCHLEAHKLNLIHRWILFVRNRVKKENLEFECLWWGAFQYATGSEFSQASPFTNCLSSFIFVFICFLASFRSPSPIYVDCYCFSRHLHLRPLPQIC